MKRSIKLKPFPIIIVCALFTFGCDRNNDVSRIETVDSDSGLAAVQEKIVRSDIEVNNAKPTVRSDTADFTGRERPNSQNKDERRANRLSDADKKIYRPRDDIMAPLPLDQVAIKGIQTLAQSYYQSDKANARIQALEEIGKISSDTNLAISTFIDALNDPDAQVRVEAVNQLSNSDQPEALTGLITALNDANPKVVIEALNNLAFMDDPILVEKISPLLANPNAQVSAAAAKTLEFLQ